MPKRDRDKRCMHCNKKCFAMRRVPVYLSCGHFFCVTCTHDSEISNDCRICPLKPPVVWKGVKKNVAEIKQEETEEEEKKEVVEDVERLEQELEKPSEVAEIVSTLVIADQEDEMNYDVVSSISSEDTMDLLSVVSAPPTIEENTIDLVEGLEERYNKVMTLNMDNILDFNVAKLVEREKLRKVPIRKMLSAADSKKEWKETYELIEKFLRDMDKKRVECAEIVKKEMDEWLEVYQGFLSMVDTSNYSDFQSTISIPSDDAYKIPMQRDEFYNTRNWQSEVESDEWPTSVDGGSHAERKIVRERYQSADYSPTRRFKRYFGEGADVFGMSNIENQNRENSQDLMERSSFAGRF